MVVGAATAAAADPLVTHLTGHPFTLNQFAGFVVVGSAWGLACDADTPHSTIARSMSLASEGGATVIGKLFGGHRHGTHSFFFAILCTALSALALAQTSIVKLHRGWHAHLTVGGLVGIGLTFCSLMLVLRIVAHVGGKMRLTRKIRVPRRPVYAAVLVAIGIALKPGSYWMPYAVGIGCCAHLIADYLTPEGVEPFWPFSAARYSLPDLAYKVRVPVVGILLRQLMIQGTERKATGREVAWVTVIVLAAGWACYPSVHAAAQRAQQAAHARVTALAPQSQP